MRLSPKHLTTGDVTQHAQLLLGVEIVTHINGDECRARIVETEAYRGADDKAAHSYGYKRTPRTEVFFGPAAHAYVYLCYGIHKMLNVIVGPEGEPNAVLIRAVEPISGLATMQRRRNMNVNNRLLTGGPGRVCQAMGISLLHNAASLCSTNGEIRLAGSLGTVSADQIIASPRVGVAYAQECAAWPWRFRESGNSFTSPAK